ncbi:hypothetical protein SDC9_195577 [bioreactor metagenome]|uniref:SLH domain-containing protein n=1 Tax=bioreactor metagenome TaxID=1076179 RepID=A0A645IKX2_9ZZZZ
MGLMTGTVNSNGEYSFNGNSNVTRAEISKIIYNFSVFLVEQQ